MIYILLVGAALVFLIPILLCFLPSATLAKLEEKFFHERPKDSKPSDSETI